METPFSGSGDENTALGYLAFWDANGNSNTAVGAYAMNMQRGSNNTAVGWKSLAGKYEVGDYNNALGWQALLENETGHRNTALGAAALQKNTNGAENTAVGVDAAFENTEGSFNTAVGRLALQYNTEGSGNIALGYQAGVNLGNGNTIADEDLDDNIFIGSPGGADDQGTIRIGGSAQSATYIAGIYGQANLWTAVAVYVDENGKLGTAPSSRRYKTNIRPLGETSAAVLRLRPVSFDYRPDAGRGGGAGQYGLIAEEVAAIMPELVVFDETGRPQTVRYHLLSTLLLNELQKQAVVVAEQARQLTRLEEELRALRGELER